MDSISDLFGSCVFNDDVMKARLPHATYKEFKRCIREGRPLDRAAADVIANAMKDWAIEKGATHYTHWFQPMTGVTAEKHESFITPDGDQVVMEFSGKELIQSEPDASSFPSGGLRSTFEARGYTAWDPTSYAFIKDATLCIPTAFCSYTGEALDKKTPLLRSMKALSFQATRILRLFGKDVESVTPSVGAEQEYFLVDVKDFDRRPDLVYAGRTLLGARAPKGQELEDHYFGTLKPRVAAYMRDLDVELWKLGIFAKTEHNEAAPASHELAPIFCGANVATDQNQLVMELMRKVAARHGLACLLHEKPFAGVNGSGKHVNWSMVTDTGMNLLEPGDNPCDNAQFLLFLSAVICAVDDHQDLLRASAASAGNDHRLGASEAPPAIVSMFLGDELTHILDALENKQTYESTERTYMNIGVDVLPRFRRDTTDRNRTSPFAFTGNKFEFRMPGSSFSTAEPCIVLNTIVADALRVFADRLEKADDFNYMLGHLVRKTVREHKRIIFNGNNYSSEWLAESEARGLRNLRTAVDAIPCMCEEKNVALYARHGIFTEAELKSRVEILLEGYCKVINIEALTMQDMVSRDVLPAILADSTRMAGGALAKKQLGLNVEAETRVAGRLCELAARVEERLEKLREETRAAHGVPGIENRAAYCRDRVCTAMQALRAAVDEAEPCVAAELWPYPTYGDMMFGVR